MKPIQDALDRKRSLDVRLGELNAVIAHCTEAMEKGRRVRCTSNAQVYDQQGCGAAVVRFVDLLPEAADLLELLLKAKARIQAELDELNPILSMATMCLKALGKKV